MSVPSEMDLRVGEFPKTCRQAGLKVTPQRIAVFEMLASTNAHPSPEEVYSVIRQTSPSISLATVYKILDLFQSQGFIRKVSTPDQVTRYDANVAMHYHMICSNCGKIQDYFPNKVPSEPLEIPESANFHVVDYEINLNGYCGSCKS